MKLRIMKKISTLTWHNLNKAKGQYISFGVFICLTAFIINIALVLAFQTFSAYDDLFDQRSEDLDMMQVL